MLDWPSRLLLALTSALVAFGLTGVALGSAGGPGEPVIPDFALLPAIPADPALDSEPAAAPTVAPPPVTPSATPGAPPPVTIALAGDVHGEPPIADVLAAGDNPLDGMADLLRSADLAVVNLETAVGSSGTPADKTFVFQADPVLLPRLAEAGVDVVTLANNHALDFGIDGAAETRELAAQAGLAVVGHGSDRTLAYAPHVVDVDGRTVAIVGLSRVFPVIEWSAGDSRAGLASAYDATAAVAAVRTAATLADHVVVTIHWGQERWICPDSNQLGLARALADAGAEVIAGHHPHVLQGIDDVDGTLVAYSLGNFAFYARTPATRQTGVLTVTLGDGGVLDHTWSPAVIDDRGQPQPVASQAPIPRDEELTDTGGPGCGPPT